MPRGAFHLANRNPSAGESFKQILRFLYDDGPHVMVDISNEIKLGSARTSELLKLMLHEGQLEKFRIGLNTYWKILDNIELDA